ncbi:SMC family ATPase, partial [Candidatus Babeliales bacterium]|nr:SMC family ATPase [Candidatus Babeliales bacterium]
KTIRQTQAKIEKIIGLDFDTFTNSAFLRQGQANEFSQKTPRERKQILANILGLSRYDRLQKLSVEHARKYIDEHKVLLRLQEQATEELEQERRCKEELEEKTKQLKKLEEESLGNRLKLEGEEKARVFLLERKYCYEQVVKEQANSKKIVLKKENELLDIVRDWKASHSRSLKFSDAHEIENKHKAFLEEEKKLRNVQQADLLFQEKIILQKGLYQKQVMHCKKVYDEQKNIKLLIVEKANLEFKQLESLLGRKEREVGQSKAKQEKTRRELAKNKIDLQKEKASLSELDIVKKQFEKRRVFYQSWIEKGNRAQKERLELEQKQKTMADKKSPSCPLCDQVLTVKRKQFLAKAFSKQEQFVVHRISRIATLLKKLKKELVLQHEELRKIAFCVDREKQLLANKDLFQKTLADLESQCKQDSAELELLQIRALAEEKKVNSLRKELEDCERKGELLYLKDERVVELKEELKLLEKERESFKYSKSDHEIVQKQLQSYEKMIEELDEFKKIILEQGERRRMVSNLSKDLKELKKEAGSLQKKVKEFCYDVEQEKKSEKKIEEVKGLLQKIMKNKEMILQEKGKLENAMQRYKTLKKESVERGKKIKSISLQVKEYQTLATMFGKDGIQALLIEEAIPEVEREANLLLSRLTDNKAQIFIESLRDLKKGGVKESLDIHISDEVGVRPYEMFSGGEAFRINFALRIAISKLLAQRAGTALQTLIIDEGF